MASQAPRSIKAILASNLRSARRDARLTQSLLAARIGVEAMTVSRWERGTSSPNETNLAALAEVLDRDFAWFYVDHTQERAA